jgi:hypothetical protein
MAGYPFDLGTYTRRVSTASPTAQAWFDRGLLWSYGFNREEAVRCFELAVEHDPGCALAHWGIAYAAGPNYNKDWDAFDAVDLHASLRRADAAVTCARATAAGAAHVERDLVDALAKRFPGPEPVEDFAPWKFAYADAMAGVQARHPDDLDVAALYADAMMNLTPWQLWEVATGEPAAGARTLEIKRVLEQALNLRGGMAHPGLLHLYVHLMEMSAHPEQALGAADALRTLVPDAGHLLHMPTHIDVLCGDYARVVAGNDAAIAADDRYAAATPRTPATSASISSTARTTTISASTAPCSAPSGRLRWRRPVRSRRCSARSSSGSRCRRWPTGSRVSSRCACTCSCASARGTS